MSQFIEVTPIINGKKSTHTEFVNVDKIIHISGYGIDGGKTTLWFGQTYSMEITEHVINVIQSIEEYE